MVKVGLVGFGFMGQMHFGIHQSSKAARVVALADVQPQRRSPEVVPVAGNLGDQAALISLEGIATFASLTELLAKSDVDMVDICLPTYLHADAAAQALEAGRHVFCEKPMAMTPEDCQRMIDAANRSGRKLTVGHCIRFWPEYVLLREMLSKGDLGKLKSLKCTRLSPRPGWAWDSWLLDPKRSGGALLDLHIHDVDYLVSLFGKPRSLFAQGTGSGADPVEHALVSYEFDDVDVCTAEGGWMMPGTFPFRMEYEAIGEKGVLSFSTLRAPALVFYPSQGEPFTPAFTPGDGYHPEIEYFVDCVENDRQPEKVMPESAKVSVEVVQAELMSIKSGRPVKV